MLRIRRSQPIASGAHGAIYNGEIVKFNRSLFASSSSSASVPVVVKLNFDEDFEVVLESVIQVYVRCLHKKIHRTAARAALIPKIHQLISTDEAHSKNLIVMERLHGNLEDLLVARAGAPNSPLSHQNATSLMQLRHKYQQLKAEIVREAMRQMSVTLLALQNECSFEHRDLHAKNIMYIHRKPGKISSAQDLQFYIVDFGLSLLRVGSQWLYDPDNTVHHNRPVRGPLEFVLDPNRNPTSRFGGDLALLALHMRDVLRKRNMWNSTWEAEAWAVRLTAVDAQIKTFEANSRTYTHTKVQRRWQFRSNNKWRLYPEAISDWIQQLTARASIPSTFGSRWAGYEIDRRNRVQIETSNGRTTNIRFSTHPNAADPPHWIAYADRYFYDFDMFRPENILAVL